jgi:hypothetical protein
MVETKNAIGLMVEPILCSPNRNCANCVGLLQSIVQNGRYLPVMAIKLLKLTELLHRPTPMRKTIRLCVKDNHFREIYQMRERVKCYQSRH